TRAAAPKARPVPAKARRISSTTVQPKVSAGGSGASTTATTSGQVSSGSDVEPVVDLTRFRSAAHLTPEQVEALGAELDGLRRRTVADLGERDREYLDDVVAMQRRLELAGRALLFAGFLPPAWLAGT